MGPAPDPGLGPQSGVAPPGQRSPGPGPGPGPGAGPTGITSVRGDSIDRSPWKFRQWIHLQIEKHRARLLWKLTCCVSDAPCGEFPGNSAMGSPLAEADPVGAFPGNAATDPKSKRFNCISA